MAEGIAERLIRHCGAGADGRGADYGPTNAPPFTSRMAPDR